MKKLNITFGTILVVLGCFAFPPAAKAAGQLSVLACATL